MTISSVFPLYKSPKMVRKNCPTNPHTPLIFKLAWRNVWRNKRRTFITLGSIGFGLAALLFQQSLIKSLQNQLVEKSTRTYTAHLQIQSSKVTDNKVPDYRLENPEAVYQAVQNIPEISAQTPRVIFTGLVSSPLTSKGSLVVGVDPLREPILTIIQSYLVEGEYLSSSKDREVIMGVKLAKELDLKLGEKLVIMVQASDGSLSAEAFRLCGLYKTDSPVYDGQIVYIPLSASQRLLVCGQEVSIVAIKAHRVEDIDSIREKLVRALEGQSVSILTWREVASEIVGIQKFQNAVLLVVMLIIFAIVALGIFNTLLMSFFERIREFGLMMALGAKPPHVASLILVESILLGCLGILTGLAFGFAIILYFGKQGIPLPISDAIGYWMPFDRIIYLKFTWPEHILSCAAALLASVLAAVFPAVHAARLKPAAALRYY